MDLPDGQAAVAASMLAKASGAGAGSTTLLLAPEEIDEAVETAKNLDYQPPGQ